MKVKELIDDLNKLNPELEIILAKDAEGEFFSPLSNIDANCIYVADSLWTGKVYSKVWTNAEAGLEQEIWEKLKSQPSCVLLEPIS